MEIIDLRSNSYSNIDFINYKNDVENLSVKYFETQIKTLKKFFEKDKLFLLSNLSSRSIHLNKISRLALFEKVLENYPKERKTLFIVDSLFEKKILEPLIASKNHKLILKISIKEIFTKIFIENIFINFMKSFYLISFFCVGSFFMNQKIYGKKINFISRNYHISSIAGTKYECRYFGDTTKFLPKKNFYNLYNLQDAYNFNDLRKIKKNSERNSYFVELNLSLADYFSVLGLSIFPLWMSLRYAFNSKKKLKNFYFSFLLASETFSTSILRNLCQIKFYRRLKINNSQIINFFDWYEGLPLNTAKIIGIKKYFPYTNFIGHYGATGERINPANSLSSFDEKLRINPDKVSFKGKIFLDNAAQHSSLKEKFISGPDFRFKSIYQKKLFNESTKLCLVLPYYDDEALNLCKFYDEVTSMKVCVKLHPVARYKKTQRYLKSNEHLFNEIKFSPLEEGNYSHILTIGSGLSLEAYMKGIVVGIISSSNFFTLDHLVNIAEPEEYKIVTNKNSFYEFMELKPNPNRAVEHLSNFPDKDSINNYFSIL